MSGNYVCCATSEAISGVWLVEQHTHCTCGAGGPEGHERACGLVPMVDLSTLPGWESLAQGLQERTAIEVSVLRTFLDAAADMGSDLAALPNPDVALIGRSLVEAARVTRAGAR